MRGGTISEVSFAERRRYIKLLDFRHFESHMMFWGSDRGRESDSRTGSQKAISDGVNVSVVLEHECANTSGMN